MSAAERIAPSAVRLRAQRLATDQSNAKFPSGGDFLLVKNSCLWHIELLEWYFS